MSSLPITSLDPDRDTRTRILAAAQRLFAESGYDSTSMNSVAQAAGVSKANVFHHFNSKQELYVEVLRESRAHLEFLFDELDLRGDLPQQLGRFLDGHLASIYERETGFRLLLHEMLTGNRHKSIAERVGGENFQRLVSNLRAAQQRGDVRSGIDPAVAAFVLIAVNVFFYQSRPVLRHMPEAGFAEHPEHYLAQVAELIAFGLAPAGDKS